MNKQPIKCDLCGKFISHKNIEQNKAKCKYIPDTEYTVEETTFICENCINKLAKLKITWQNENRH